MKIIGIQPKMLHLLRFFPDTPYHFSENAVRFLDERIVLMVLSNSNGETSARILHGRFCIEYGILFKIRQKHKKY